MNIKNGFYVVESISDLDNFKCGNSFWIHCSNKDCGAYSFIKFYKPAIRNERFKHIICSKCYAKENALKKYGVDSIFKSDYFKKKAKETNLKNLGVEYPGQAKSCQEKKKQKCIELYGSPNNINKVMETQRSRNNGLLTVQTEEFKEESKKTKLERYGDYNYNNREKAKRTNLEIYGYEVTSKSPEVKKKRFETCEKLYGDKTYSNRRKSESTTIKHYGVKCYPQTKEFAEFMRKGYKNNPKWITNRENACLEKYGTTHFAGSKSLIYDNKYFDSKSELYYYIYMTDKGNLVEREPEKLLYTTKSDNKIHKCLVDFKVNGEKYVEIKGTQFYKGRDPTSDLIMPYSKKNWTDEDREYECEKQKAKGEMLKSRKDVEIIPSNSKILNECKQYVDNTYGLNFVNQCALYNLMRYAGIMVYDKAMYIKLFTYNNNEGRGMTPFDINREKVSIYAINDSIGLTPFDIRK